MPETKITHYSWNPRYAYATPKNTGMRATINLYPVSGTGLNMGFYYEKRKDN